MKNKNQQFTPIRFSHLTSYAGIGSIVRGIEDKLMAIVDTRYWNDRSNNISAEIIPCVNRITMALDIDKDLRMPPAARENSKGDIDGSYLPAVIFPTYAVCGECGLLHNNPWRKQNKSFADNVVCEKCNKLLKQVTWCAVSDKGYLDDVPWHFICHQKSGSGCRVDYDTAYLSLDTSINGKRIIKCTKCGSFHNYENIQLNYISKQQPWIFGESPKMDNDDIIKIIEVNDPRVYLPKRVNALVIPPESRVSKNVLFNISKFRSEISKISEIKIPLRKKAKIKKLATEFRRSVEEIKDAEEKIANGYSGCEDNITVGELFEDEYKAFLKPLENLRDDEDFVTDHKTKQWHKLEKTGLSEDLLAIVKMIDKQIVVKRLREIQVFKGFCRSQEVLENGVLKNLVPPDITGESDWLPAIELFGEGVFFTLDEKVLSDWEKIPNVIKRAEEIADRYEKSEVTLHQDITITPRFLLLHTLSHLLIRELESTSGYPAASLKERIYCSKGRNMAGVLIYTAVADIVGSLGGIIESAEPTELLKLMDGVFKHAEWCSLDPVCTEHEGQGPGWLNRAACHSCALIPEPGCEYNNVFLDRVFIKGNETLKIPNFLDFIMENHNGKKKI